MSNIQNHRFSLRKLLITALSLLPVLFACAFANGQQEEGRLEQYNRDTFRMNQTLDRAILKPVATVYDRVIPTAGKMMLSNFFSNIDEIPGFLNSLLQARGNESATSLFRFMINSTIGVFGLIDVATHLGVKQKKNDFGLTLGRWGIKESPYFVIPLLGPSTVRDAIATPLNFRFFSLYQFIEPPIDRYALRAFGYVGDRAAVLNIKDTAEQGSIDFYVFARDAYLQKRNVELNSQGLTSAEDLTSDYVTEESVR